MTPAYDTGGAVMNKNISRPAKANGYHRGQHMYSHAVHFSFRVNPSPERDNAPRNERRGISCIPPFRVLDPISRSDRDGTCTHEVSHLELPFFCEFYD